jgi:hypothetical protein
MRFLLSQRIVYMTDIVCYSFCELVLFRLSVPTTTMTKIVDKMTTELEPQSLPRRLQGKDRGPDHIQDEMRICAGE